MIQLVYKVYCTNDQVPFYFWQTKLPPRNKKLSNFYVHDCRRLVLVNLNYVLFLLMIFIIITFSLNMSKHLYILCHSHYQQLLHYFCQYSNQFFYYFMSLMIMNNNFFTPKMGDLETIFKHFQSMINLDL